MRPQQSSLMVDDEVSQHLKSTIKVDDIEARHDQEYPVVGRTLKGAANLAKLLPTGTVLAFHSLSPSFSNHGTCVPANRYLTLALIAVCALTCCFFSFTDSILVGKSVKNKESVKGLPRERMKEKLYVGVATPTGFYPFNRRHSDLPAELRRKLRIQWVDCVHAAFSSVVFVALALSDSSVQSCLFGTPCRNLRVVLVNLPLGVGSLSSLVFTVLPTTRRGFGYSDMTPPRWTPPESAEAPTPYS